MKLILSICATSMGVLSLVMFAFGFAEGRDRSRPSPCALSFGGAE